MSHKLKYEFDNNEDKANYVSKEEFCNMLDISEKYFNDVNKTVAKVVRMFNIKKLNISRFEVYYNKDDIQKSINELCEFQNTHINGAEAKKMCSNLSEEGIKSILIPSHYKLICRDTLNEIWNIKVVYKKSEIDDYIQSRAEIDRKIESGEYLSTSDASKMLNMSDRMFLKLKQSIDMNEIRYYQGFYFEKNVIEKLVKEQEEFFSEYIPKSVVKNKYFTPKTFPSHEEKLTKYEAPRIAYTLEYTSTMIKDSSWFKISEVEELAKELSEKKRTIKKERTKAKKKESEKTEENAVINDKELEFNMVLTKIDYNSPGYDINHDILGSTYFHTFQIRLNELNDWNGFNPNSEYTNGKWFGYIKDKLDSMRANEKVSNARVNHYVRCTLALKSMLDYYGLDEVYSLTTNQINTYFNIIKTNIIRINIYEFLGLVSKDVQLVSGNKRCGFRMDKIYSPHRRESSKTIDDIYDFDVYSDLFKYLVDIDLHVKNSIYDIKVKNSIRYASTWLYVMLHMNNAWRNGDVTEFPKLDIDDLLDEFKIYEYSWFENNKLSIAKARAVISRVIQHEFKISKTQVEGTFFCSDELAPSMATNILILTLYHKSRSIISNNSTLMDFGTKYNKVGDSHFNKFFKEFKHKNFKFLSRTMNKTVMTFVYYLANLSGDSKALIYAQKLREHLSEDSTLHYLNLDKSKIESLSKQLFMRGEFGYITNMLLTRVYDENVTNFEEATEAIVRINDIFGDVFKIHSTAGFLNTIRVERQAVIDTLAEKSFNECQEILTDLFARKLPSREDNVQCLVSKEGCKRIDLKSCFECQYHIPSIYALTTLCESMIEDMKNYHNVKGVKKYKLALSIDRKSILLKEAMDILTPEYVYNCLGLTRDEFKSQLNLIDMPEDFLEDKELLER